MFLPLHPTTPHPRVSTVKCHTIELNDMTFAKWMDRIDDLCQPNDDMAIHDLPEPLFQDAYYSGCSPLAFVAGHTAHQRASTFLSVVDSPALPSFGLVRAVVDLAAEPYLTESILMSQARLSGVIRKESVG
jgi:hypothetical protein